MTEFRLNHLEALHWLWAVAAIAGALVLGAHLRRRSLRRFATAELHERLAPEASAARRRLRGVLLVAAAVGLVAALMDPRWGVSYEQVQQRGIDMVVVLDVSRSMNAADARSTTRLEKARQLIGDLADQLAGDRVGLVTFAGSAWLACPLTIDYGAFRLALTTASPETAPLGGSLLGDALRVAAEAFTDEVPDHKVIVVFSDGEDHGSYAVEAAGRIRQEQSIPIYTVGIGDDEQGSRIPAAAGRGWLTHDGEEVVSRMDRELLQQVAEAGGGVFVPVGTGTIEMSRLYEERIAPVAKRDLEATTLKRHHARYQWFAGLALVLLMLESWIGARRPAAARAGAAAHAPAERRSRSGARAAAMEGAA